MVSKPKSMDVSKIIGYKVEREEYFLTSKDAILYSLGIGFSENQLKKEDLNFTYENADNFQPFPTIIGSVTLKINEKVMFNHPHLPEFNPMSILHGEQWTEILSPLVPDTKIFLEGELIDFEDKGSGTVFVIGCTIYDEENKIIGKTRSVIFCRDIKGHKYKSTGILKTMAIPAKAPENKKPLHVLSYKTNPNQAILYRLGGFDLNPLHIDKDMAAMGGFEIPILHGMCFYGIACKAIFESVTPHDVWSILSFNVRFTSHVFPGETLEVSIYNGNGGKLLVSVKTKERGKQVLIGEALIKSPKF